MKKYFIELNYNTVILLQLFNKSSSLDEELALSDFLCEAEAKNEMITKMSFHQKAAQEISNKLDEGGACTAFWKSLIKEAFKRIKAHDDLIEFDLNESAHFCKELLEDLNNILKEKN